MDRITFRVTEQQMDKVEEMVESGEYPNKSEVVRAAVREITQDFMERQNVDGSAQKRNDRDV